MRTLWLCKRSFIFFPRKSNPNERGIHASKCVLKLIQYNHGNSYAHHHHICSQQNQPPTVYHNVQTITQIITKKTYFFYFYTQNLTQLNNHWKLTNKFEWMVVFFKYLQNPSINSIIFIAFMRKMVEIACEWVSISSMDRFLLEYRWEIFVKKWWNYVVRNRRKRNQ